MFQETKAIIHQGDCLAVLRQMAAGCIQLAYLDPPFFTQKIHSLGTRDRQREFSFADLWESQAEYAEFLFLRLREIQRVLAPNGSVFFHCDRSQPKRQSSFLE